MRSLLFLLSVTLAAADEIIVREADSLRAALRDLKPATRLKIGPGDYTGGHHVSGQTANGLNLDDGGDLANPVTGITIERVEISDIGPSLQGGWCILRVVAR
jgi:hypothetical protein